MICAHADVKNLGDTLSQKKNSEVFSEVIVGVFMTAVLGLLIYFTIIISGMEVFDGKSKVPVKAFFTDVGVTLERARSDSRS